MHNDWWQGTWQEDRWGWARDTMMGHWPMIVPGLVLLMLFIVAGVAIWRLSRPVRGAVEERLARGAVSRLPWQGSARGPGLLRGTPPERHGRELGAVLIIPDITGYTRFMSMSQLSLGHAQYLISQLLNAVIMAAEGRLTAAKVEGDAVLLWAEKGPAGTPDVVDPRATERILGNILSSFYRRRAELAASNVCKCEGCRHLEDLDLKIVVHTGRILVYKMHGREELSGMPVITAHRLLKNDLGRRAYVLVTEEARPDCDLTQMFGAPEACGVACEDIGEVQARIYLVDPEAFTPSAVQPAPFSHKLGETVEKLRTAMTREA